MSVSSFVPTADKPYPDKMQLLHTNNMHLANLLRCLDFKCLSVTYGPDKTPLGQPKAKWWFEATDACCQAVKLWQDCGDPDKTFDRDWEQFTREEQQIAMRVLSCFCDMLKSTLVQAKGNR